MWLWQRQKVGYATKVEVGYPWRAPSDNAVPEAQTHGRSGGAARKYAGKHAPPAPRSERRAVPETQCRRRSAGDRGFGDPAAQRWPGGIAAQGQTARKNAWAWSSGGAAGNASPLPMCTVCKNVLSTKLCWRASVMFLRCGWVGSSPWAVANGSRDGIDTLDTTTVNGRRKQQTL